MRVKRPTLVGVTLMDKKQVANPTFFRCRAKSKIPIMNTSKANKRSGHNQANDKPVKTRCEISQNYTTTEKNNV
jgi:hypothetical protein